MKKLSFAWLLASPLCLACVSIDAEQPHAGVVSVQPVAESVEANAASDATPPAQAPQADSAETLAVGVSEATSPKASSESTASDPASLEEIQALSVWSDPRYADQFQASFLSLSRVEPSLTLEEREVMQKVMEDLAAGKTERAMGRLERKGGPEASAVFDFTLANLHFQADHLPEAKQLYGVAVEKFPKFQRAWKNLGLIHVRDGEMRAAGEAFSRVVQLGGCDAVTYGLLGFAHTSAGQAIAAESAYRMAIMLDPYTLDWQIGLARSFFKQKRFAEAASQCGALIEQFPERGDFWLLQANAFIGMNEVQKAAENLAMADRLGASSYDSMVNLGDIYINTDLPDLAVDAHIKALELAKSPKTSRAMRAAKILIAKGELEATQRIVDAIERIAGAGLPAEEAKDLLKLKARVAVASGQADEELRVLESIVELDPLDGEALILLGQSYARSGDSQQAIFYYERAEGIEKSEADARVRHAQLLVKEARYAEALPLLRRAQAIQPREDIRKYMEQIERIMRKG